MTSLPEIEVYAHHPTSWVTPEWLTEKAVTALPLCLSGKKGSEPPLSTLQLVEVSIVSDEAIARVHGEFMDDPTPTDVITFQHGEILISADTAARSAKHHCLEPKDELLLYLIHGLLHLAGWEDHAEEERNAMHALQEQILQKAIKP